MAHAQAKLLTYNVGLLHIGFLGKTIVEPAPYLEERYRDLAKHLLAVDADFIALQEIYARPHREGLVTAMAERFPFAATHVKWNPLRLSHGLLSLSKWPITQSYFKRFKSAPLEEKLFANRGVLVSLIAPEGFGRIALLNTHLTSGGLRLIPHGPKANEFRRKEVLELLSVANALEVDHVFVVGDLNAGPDVSMANYHEVLKGGYVDALNDEENGLGAEDRITWDPENPLNSGGPHDYCPPQSVDHVFMRKTDAESVRVVKTQIVFRESVIPVPESQVPLSDHFGLWVHLEKPA